MKNRTEFDVDELLYADEKPLSENGRCFVMRLVDPRTGKYYKKRVMNKNVGNGADKQLLSACNTYKALQRIKDCAIPHIYFVDADEETLVVIEEWVEGEPLQDMLDRGASFSAEEISEITLQLCSILEKLQEGKIIHRDIKPSNIIWNKGKVWLIDFDIAREASSAAEHDTRFGYTRGYAAPEQFGYAATDIRSDLYSMGATVEQMMNCQKLQDARLHRVVEGCKAFDPQDRFQNLKDVRRALAGKKVWSARQKKERIKRKHWALSAAVFLLIAVAATLQTARRMWKVKSGATVSYALLETASTFGAPQYDTPIRLTAAAHDTDPLGTKSLAEFTNANGCNIRYVADGGAGTAIRFIITNPTDAALKNAQVDVLFAEALIPSLNFYSCSENVTPKYFANGMGAYLGFQWNIEKSIRPHGSAEVEIDLSGASVEMNTSCTVTVTADSFSGYRTVIPVEIFPERAELNWDVVMNACDMVNAADTENLVDKRVFIYGRFEKLKDNVGYLYGGAMGEEPNGSVRCNLTDVDYPENFACDLDLAAIQGVCREDAQGKLYLEDALLVRSYKMPDWDRDEQGNLDLSCYLGSTVYQLETYCKLPLVTKGDGYETADGALQVFTNPENPAEIKSLSMTKPIWGYCICKMQPGNQKQLAEQKLQNYMICEPGSYENELFYVLRGVACTWSEDGQTLSEIHCEKVEHTVSSPAQK